MKQRRCAKFVVALLALAMVMGMCPTFGLAEEPRNEDVEPLDKNVSLLQNEDMLDEEGQDQNLVQIQNSGSADSLADPNQTNNNFEVTAEAATHEHGGVTFVEWKSTTELPTTAGSYYLTDDVTLSSTWIVPEGVAINLCLNGHAIKTDASFSNTYAIQVSLNGTLDLYDCVGGGLVTCSKPGGVNTGVDSEGNATFNMRGGEISGFEIGVGTNLTLVEKDDKPVGTYGKFNMYGGTIKDNGIHGVYVFSGSFNMYDGTISGNGGGDSGSNGAGVYVNYSDFAMKGGVISGNNAHDNGGGLYAFRVGTVQISGGKIQDNTAGINGGGIVVDKNAITVSGGEISGNTAAQNGGGIWVGANPDSVTGLAAQGSSDGGTLNLTGGTITNNTASKDGGGIYVQEGSTLKVSGASKVGSNTSSNVYLPALTMTVDGKLADGASIGVTHVNKDGATDTSAFTTGYKSAGNTADPATYFTSDDTNYDVVWTEDGNEARLAKKIYHIAFDANGGEGSMSGLDVEAGTSATLPANDFSRSGYVFTGWNTAADGSGTSYANEGIVTPEGNMTLYAQWEESKVPPAPVVSNSREGKFTSVTEEITYTVSQEIPDYVSSMKIWVDLEPVLYFTTDEDGVVVRTSDGEEVAADVSIDGQRLTVSVADVTPLRGKTVEVLYKAKLRDDADLSPYLSDDKSFAYVPYQATTQFDGREDWTLESNKEVVKYRVSSSKDSSSKSGGSSSSTKSTLAKTADPASFAATMLLSVAGAGFAFAGRKRRK